MPSCNAANLAAMAKELKGAASTQDWPRLQRLDAALQQWLHGEAEAVVQPASRALWADVALAHAQARQACADAKSALAAQMAELSDNREARKAYAWQEVLK